jgi:hypothetical protein
MGWAAHYIEKLKQGETVSFRPRGSSMTGKIESGQLCTVVPVDPASLEVGDIVLCKVNGTEYLHLIKAIQGPRFQIGNNRGRINGWITARSIYGRCTRVEPWVRPDGVLRRLLVTAGVAADRLTYTGRESDEGELARTAAAGGAVPLERDETGV